jgi:hypothetical protein
MHSLLRRRGKPRAYLHFGHELMGRNALDERQGRIETSPSDHSSRRRTERNGHNLVTEILTILFPPPKQR